MHIPDGYLSPSTCAVMTAAALPFWALALHKVRQTFRARLAPMLSLAAAFSFVVMMFNLPLPGGTTGHAVGIGIATVALGPWAAMLAVSVALAIQAIFFGDGGILAFGANSFNIAIVGALVTHAVYRLVAGKAGDFSAGAAHAVTPETSPAGNGQNLRKIPRRILAATLGGYAAINVAALFTAVEFGVQPALFHDAGGAPLYAPYGLSVAIPAMMLGHLTFAGCAEAILTGGILAWMLRNAPELLPGYRRSASAIGSEAAGPAGIATTDGASWSLTRPLWIGLAALMIATPLGLLAAGTAWGEWGAEDFANPEARAGIAAGSLGKEVPISEAPAGLAKWSEFWSAPIPDYAPQVSKNAPAFLRVFQHEAVGYIASAVLGLGLILAACIALQAALRWRRKTA